MIAVLRKELRLAFSSISTYVFFTLLLLSFAILSVIFNLILGYASLSYPLGYMTLLLIPLVSLLVFFSARREKKGGMESLLFSLPLSPTAAVIGSFLGQWLLLLIPSLVFFLLPPLFSLIGSSQIAASEVALLGYVLYATLLLSVNRLLFSALKRPIFALILSVCVNLLLYFLNQIYFYLPLDGILENILSLFNPTGIYYSFTYGKFNLTGMIYFVSVIALILFGEILVQKSKRGDFSNKKRRIQAKSVLAAVILLLLLSNVFLSFLPEKVKNLDVTGSDMFRISNTTKDTLNGIDSPTEIYLLCAGGKKHADKDYLSFLTRYDQESENVSLTIVDTEKDPDFVKAYTSENLSDQSLIVTGNGRHTVLDRADLYHYENPTLGSFSSSDYDYLISSYLRYLQTGSLEGLTEQSVMLGQQLYYSVDTVAFFDGDNLLCNAVRFAAEKNIPTVYVIVGDSFTSPDGTIDDVLTKNGFFLQDLTLSEKIPDRCDVLVLFAPKKDITEAEKKNLAAYLSRGGKLLLSTDYSSTNLPNLLSVLSAYGLSTSPVPHVVCESNHNTYVSEDSPYFFSTKIASCPATGEDFNGSYVSLLSHAITLKEIEGVQHTNWLKTGEKGYIYDPTSGEIIEEGAYTCGAIAQKGASTVIWISSPLSLSSTGYVASGGDNFLLLLSSFRWMCGNDFNPISIESTTVPSDTLYVPNEQLLIWVLLIAVIIPLIPISIGVIHTYVRKKR